MFLDETLNRKLKRLAIKMFNKNSLDFFLTYELSDDIILQHEFRTSNYTLSTYPCSLQNKRIATNNN